MLGFEGIELAIGAEPDSARSSATSRSDCETIRRQLEDAQLVCETLASGMTWTLSPTSDDEETREKSIAFHGDALQRVQVNDNKEDFDWSGSYHSCDLLERQVPWSEVMSSLRKIEYDKTIAAEMMPWRKDLLSATQSAIEKILKM